MSGDRPLLDACLIVKDEERNLPACLDSLGGLRPLLNEVLVYDTGSQDRTIEIARARGARVVEGHWDGDFSRARNESLAMSTATWVLIIDADEQVVAAPDVLGRVLRAADSYDVLDASLTHVDDTGAPIGHSSYGAVLRIDTVRYTGRIHEVATRVDGQPTRTATLSEDQLTFLHTGYATSEIRRDKAERNARGAADDLQETLLHGDAGKIAEARYHLARSLLRLDSDDSAPITELDAAFDGFAAGAVGRDRVLAVLVPELLRRGDSAGATARVARHMREGGAVTHCRYLVAEIAIADGRFTEALAALARIPDEGDPIHEVDPRQVLARRLRALDGLERWDEALACVLVLVGRWLEVAWAPDLMDRLRGQDARDIAELLAPPDGGSVPDVLLRELEACGPKGADVAARLRAGL